MKLSKQLNIHVLLTLQSNSGLCQHKGTNIGKITINEPVQIYNRATQDNHARKHTKSVSEETRSQITKTTIRPDIEPFGPTNRKYHVHLFIPAPSKNVHTPHPLHISETKKNNQQTAHLRTPHTYKTLHSIPKTDNRWWAISWQNTKDKATLRTYLRSQHKIMTTLSTNQGRVLFLHPERTRGVLINGSPAMER